VQQVVERQAVTLAELAAQAGQGDLQAGQAGGKQLLAASDFSSEVNRPDQIKRGDVRQ
jgi:hypothetical protein